MSDKLLKKAINKHKAGQHLLAQSLYKKILKSQPNHIDANYMLGTLYAETGEYSSALKYLKLAEVQAPDSQFIKNNMGNAYRLSGYYEEAMEKYQQALSIQPDMIQALNNLAIVFRRLNNNQQAIDLYKSAIAISPDFTEAHYNLGKSYWDDGKYADAFACFQRVLDIDQNHALAHHEVGNYHLKVDDKPKAVASYEKYLSLVEEDNCGAKLKLSYLKVGEIPKRQPEQLIKQTYEKKARTWDQDVERADMVFLGPGHIQDAIAELDLTSNELTILDIGCGTGLCAPYLKRRSRQLYGVDLSSHMLALADKKDLYDELICDDIVNYLLARDKKENPLFDLIVGSGVMIFYGDLVPVLEAAANRLTEDGYFIFTLYQSDSGDIAIRDNMHFAHSDKYIKQVAEGTGFQVRNVKSVVHEYEHDQPQAGFVVCLSMQARPID